MTQSVNDALRPVVEQLAGEISLCIRYHSVTFRGKPLVRMILGGGEASACLAESLNQRVDLDIELGDPLRSYQSLVNPGRKSQWDVAAGLALREVI